METEHLADDGLHSGVLVFEDKAGNFLRQVGILQHFGDQVLVENGSRLGVFGKIGVEFFGQNTGHGFRTGAGLAGKGDEGKMGGGAECCAVFLADEIGAVFGKMVGV